MKNIAVMLHFGAIKNSSINEFLGYMIFSVCRVFNSICTFFHNKKTYKLKPWYNISDQTKSKEGIYMSIQNYITDMLELKDNNVSKRQYYYW